MIPPQPPACPAGAKPGRMSEGDDRPLSVRGRGLFASEEDEVGDRNNGGWLVPEATGGGNHFQVAQDPARGGARGRDAGRPRRRAERARARGHLGAGSGRYRHRHRWSGEMGRPGHTLRAAIWRASRLADCCVGSTTTCTTAARSATGRSSGADLRRSTRSRIAQSVASHAGKGGASRSGYVRATYRWTSTTTITRRFVLALASVLAQEAFELEAAGATIIQFDEPALLGAPEDLDLAQRGTRGCDG